MANNIGSMIVELEQYSNTLLSDDDGSINSVLLPKIVDTIARISKIIDLSLEYNLLEIKNIIKYEYAKPASFYIANQIKDAKDYQENKITEDELLSESKNVKRNMYFNGVCAPNREYNRVTNNIEIHIYLKNVESILRMQKMGIRTTIKHELQREIPDMIIENIDSIQNKTMQIVASNLEANKAQGFNQQYAYHIPGRSFMAPNSNIELK
jgi:hypothetical protein